LIERAFGVDERVLAEFRAFLDARKLSYTEADLAENREAVSRAVQEEVLRQVFGEREARQRTLAWDTQFQKALEVVPRAERLVRDPMRFAAEQEAERRAGAGGAPETRP
jgi:carboxyl-terminal processing protease